MSEQSAAGAPAGTLARVDARVAALRADDTTRRVAFVGALAVGLGLAWVHWLGLVVGGALVALTRQRRWEGFAAALGFGLLALAATVALVPGGSAGELLAVAPLSYLGIAAALLGPLWGALARLVV
jgi:hypothetical protein